MLDKDKLWMVLYVNVSMVNTDEVPQYIESVKKSFTYDESVEVITCPIMEGESRIEIYK